MNTTVVCVVCSNYLSSAMTALQNAGVARSGIAVLAPRGREAAPDSGDAGRNVRQMSREPGTASFGGILRKMLGVSADAAARLEQQLKFGRCLLVVQDRDMEKQRLVVDVLRRSTYAFDIQISGERPAPQASPRTPPLAIRTATAGPRPMA